MEAGAGAGVGAGVGVGASAVCNAGRKARGELDRARFPFGDREAAVMDGE